jgi:ribosomal protein L9
VKDPIKALGTYRVQIKLHPEVMAELPVNVKEQG